MIYQDEATLIAPNDGVAGSVVFVPKNDGSGWFGIVAAVEAAQLTIFRLHDLSQQIYNSFAVQPFVQLGAAVLRFDAASSAPLNEEFAAGAFIMAPGISGIFMPGRFGRQGMLLTLQGQIVDHEQGAREAAFEKYEIGFMRGDTFKSVHRVGFKSIV